MKELVDWLYATANGGGAISIIVIVGMILVLTIILGSVIMALIWIVNNPGEAFAFVGLLILSLVLLALFWFAATGPKTSVPGNAPAEGETQISELTPIAEVSLPPPPPPAQPTPTLDPSIPVYDPNNPTIGQVNLTPATTPVVQQDSAPTVEPEHTSPPAAQTPGMAKYVGGSGMQEQGCPTIVIRAVSRDGSGMYIFLAAVNGLETTWTFDPSIETVPNVFQLEGGCYLHLRVDATQHNNQGMPAILWHMQAP